MAVGIGVVGQAQLLPPALGERAPEEVADGDAVGLLVGVGGGVGVYVNTLRIEKLRAEIAGRMGMPVHVNIEEVRKPEVEAQLVAESVAQQLERRIMFRRAMKRAVSNSMRIGAEGIKISVGGRLNGAEIARTEWYREGRVPLHTLRADIDYGTAEANTTYGVIGVKVWIFKGEVFDTGEEAAPATEAASR